MNKKLQEQRLYSIQPQDAVSFRCGCSSDGDQIMLGVPGPYVLTLWFDHSGHLIRHAAEAPNGVAVDVGSRPKKLSGPVRQQLWELVQNVELRLGLVPSPIRIQAFDLPEYHVSITDFPVELLSVFSDPNASGDDPDRQRVARMVNDWHDQGKFVLHWGNEYWMNRLGEVTDT